MYGHSDDTNSTNGFVTPYDATRAPSRAGIARLEEVMVDRLVDQLELARIDLRYRSISERRLSELMMIASATRAERG